MTGPISTLPKGTWIVRTAAALAQARGDTVNAAATAAGRWGMLSPPARFLKAAAEAGSTIPGESWGAELGDYQAQVAEFFGLVQQKSIVGRMSGLRTTPPNTPILEVIEGATASWVKQGRPKPVSEMRFARRTLGPLKLSSIVIVTMELLRLADRASETRLREDLVAAIALALDVSFFDPANGGVEDVEPVSVTYGLTPVAGTGDASADLGNLIGSFQGDLSTAYLVMQPAVAATLTSVAFPDVGARGGEVATIPVLTGPGAPADAIVLIDPTGIAYVRDTIRLDGSSQASIEMQTVPAGSAVVGLWQGNLAALRAELYTNWEVGRAGAVSILSPLG